MKLAEDVYLLPIPRAPDEADHLNLTLILDEEAGPTLVDAGLLGRVEEIEAGLDEAGIALEIDTIVCYHGEVVSEDASGQLRRVLQESR